MDATLQRKKLDIQEVLNQSEKKKITLPSRGIGGQCHHDGQLGSPGNSATSTAQGMLMLPTHARTAAANGTCCDVF
eukprot:1193527-Prorocentrum_minimum.AAC.1